MSKVYFTKEITPESVSRIFEMTLPAARMKAGELCAIKTHFGEKGNLGYVRPALVRPVAARIKELGAKPFLTDANTIYVGQRAESVSHMEVARSHGFTGEEVLCPVIIADGLRGNAGVEVEINRKHFKKVKVANAIHYSDSIVFVTHFKGHEMTGFGGALKNAGMGCATRAGKYQLHNSIKPKVKYESCTGCGECMKWCPGSALSLMSIETAAAINGAAPVKMRITFDESKCTGCGECILSCKKEVFRIPWDETVKNCQEKIVEYAEGVLRKKLGEKRVTFINFINYVTKYCDCYETKGKPELGDVGIAASDDPVAIDRASVDIIREKYGSDLFRKFWPEIDYEVQLKYAEQLGLGENKYELVVSG
jgi:hypothetical protein